MISKFFYNRVVFGSLFFLYFIFSVNLSYAVEESLNIYSPNYFSEQNNVYDPIHYLEKEILSFKFCTEEDAKNITARLECNDEYKKIDLFDLKNENGCYFSNYNLNDTLCDDFQFKINFELNNKEKTIVRYFEKQTQSMLINHVISENPDLLDPEELSYYLIVLNNIDNKDGTLSQDIYDELKNNRNNNLKCWPKASCEIETTSTILRNLKIAGYPEDSRIMQDGRKYLEDTTISNDNNPLKFVIEIDHDFDNDSHEIECVVRFDGDDEEDYPMSEDDNIIEDKASYKIEFSCDEQIDEIEFKLYNLNGNIQFRKTYTDSIGFSYNLDSFSCIGKSSKCDFESSFNTLAAFTRGYEYSSEVKKYLESLIVEEDDEIYIDNLDKIVDSGKFLYINKNLDMVEYVEYNQNNDGSWGSNSKYDRIIKSSWAVLGLQSSTSNSEYISDGKKWIYYNEPSSGWGDIMKNSLAYLAIKEQIKPFLSMNSVNEIRGVREFNVENPTIYKIRNLNVKVDPAISSYVAYVEDLGDLDGEATISFNVSVNDDFYGFATGNIYLTGLTGSSNTEISLVEFPVNIVGGVALTIDEGNFLVTMEDKVIKLPVDKKIPDINLECNFINPFTNKKQKTVITDVTKIIEIENKNLVNGNYSINFECLSKESNSFNLVADIVVDVANDAFDLSQSTLYITNGNDVGLNLTSLLDDKQTLVISIEGDYAGMIVPTEERKIIAAKDSREIFFSVNSIDFLSNMGNTSSGNVLIESSNGHIEKIPIIINILPVVEETNNNSVLIIAISIVAFIIVLISIIRYIRNKRAEREAEEISSQYDEEIYFDDNEFN